MADWQRRSSSFNFSPTCAPNCGSRSRAVYTQTDPQSTSHRGLYLGRALQPSALGTNLETDATPGDYCWQTPAKQALLDLEIGIAIEFVFVKSLHCLGLGERHSSFLNRPFAVPGDPRIQLVGVVLHVLEDLVGGIAFDDFFDPPTTPILQPNVHDVGVAEQVVQIA